jgi:hypothetical protein
VGDIGAVIETIRPGLHLVLHVAVPAVVAWQWGGRRKAAVFVLLMLSMLIDLDHLLANPIYAPGRCSVGFHPLHQWPAILVYAGLTFARATRWFGMGALIHIALDFLDCFMMA